MGRIQNLEIAVSAQTPAPLIISCAILEKLLNFSVSVMSPLNCGNSPYEENESEVTVSWPTFCDPMDCNLPDSSIHGIFQARILEWVAISFSKGSSQPRDWTWVSHTAGRLFTIWATGETESNFETLGLVPNMEKMLLKC